MISKNDWQNAIIKYILTSLNLLSSLPVLTVRRVSLLTVTQEVHKISSDRGSASNRNNADSSRCRNLFPHSLELLRRRQEIILLCLCCPLKDDPGHSSGCTFSVTVRVLLPFSCSQALRGWFLYRCLLTVVKATLLRGTNKVEEGVGITRDNASPHFTLNDISGGASPAEVCKIILGRLHKCQIGVAKRGTTINPKA